MDINLAMLVKENLTADEYIWLHQKYFETNIPVKGSLDKSKLQTAGWVKVLPDQIVLRQKTVNLMEGGDYVYDEKAEEEAEEKKAKATISSAKASVKDWIEEYRDLFPKKTNSGRLLRGTPSGCIKKMTTFIGNNSTRKNVITKEQVMNATKQYLNAQKRGGYMYTKAANYFIEKDGDSQLYQHIEQLDDNTPLVHDGTSNMTDDI